ncbi:hypothetical protein GCM10027168_00960 [Streptomyces capparidis]
MLIGGSPPSPQSGSGVGGWCVTRCTTFLPHIPPRVAPPTTPTGGAVRPRGLRPGPDLGVRPDPRPGGARWGPGGALGRTEQRPRSHTPVGPRPSVELENARVQHLTLLQGGAHRAV